MRYFAIYNENGKLLAIGTGYGGTEITEEEYNSFEIEIDTKSDLVNKLYLGEITIEGVPPEWREEIQRRVEKRIATEGEVTAAEATAEDYQSALREMGVEV